MTRLTSEQALEVTGWTCQWFEAVERQAQRIAEEPHFGASQTDVLLFTVALRNVIRGAEALLGRDHPALEAFRNVVPATVDVRDQLEHFDDYVQGVGNKQRGRVSAERWLVYFSSNPGVRSVHVGSHELEVHSASRAASDLVGAAIRKGRA